MDRDPSVDSSRAREGIQVPYRQPLRAALWSLALAGCGQLYNKQLEKAVLLWIWTAILAGLGLVLLVMGALGTWIPREWARPPLGDWIADHAPAVFGTWLLAMLVLWAFSVRDAWTSAGRINRGEVVIRYPLRRQAVHVLASQILGSIPVVGLFFPPGIVAEAADAVRERRSPDRARLLAEGRQAVLEWAITRAAVYGLWAFLVLWLLAWLLRLGGR